MTSVRLTLDRGQFAGKTGRGVRIAVVDSGIAAGHPHVGEVASGVCLICEEDGRTDSGDRHGHGTAVAAAIREKAPEAELIAVRVFERTLATQSEVLAQAMRWAADHGAHLINLSLGTPNASRGAILSEALDHATSRGALVVAALESDGHAMFPGALPGAVGVRLDPHCARDELIVHQPASRSLHLAASGFPRPIPGVPPERNLFGISFAVANGTGFLARLLEGRSATSPGELAELIESAPR
ncbi:MAG: S8 family peptidase [Gemmatimonadaceae bacterium]